MHRHTHTNTQWLFSACFLVKAVGWTDVTPAAHKLGEDFLFIPHQKPNYTGGSRRLPPYLRFATLHVNHRVSYNSIKDDCCCSTNKEVKFILSSPLKEGIEIQGNVECRSVLVTIIASDYWIQGDMRDILAHAALSTTSCHFLWYFTNTMYFSAAVPLRRMNKWGWNASSD